MLLLRLAPIFFVIIFHWSKQTLLSARYEKFENCTASGKSVKIHQCEVKDDKIYFNASFIKPIDNIILEAAVLRKVLNNFRPMLPMPKIKWCELMRNKAVKLSPVLKMLKVSLNAYVPQLFENCPYSGDLKVDGLSLPLSVSSWFPTGHYKFSIYAYNDEDNLVFATTIIMIKDN